MSLNGSGRKNDIPPNDDDVRTFLGTWPTPQRDPAAVSRLMTALHAERLPVAWINPPRLSPRDKVRQAALIVRAQVKVVGWVTWIASLLVISFGVLVTFLYSAIDAGSMSAVPLVILAPLVTAVGVAFVYGEDADPGMEIQQAAPVSPQVLLLARLTLLFGFDLLLSLVGSVFLTAFSAGFSLAPLIASWLVPMTFLSAMAFVMSVLFFDPLASVLLAVGLWSALVVRHYLTLPLIIHTPDLLSPELHPLLMAIAAALVAAALWWTGRDERYLRSNHD